MLLTKLVLVFELSGSLLYIKFDKETGPPLLALCTDVVFIEEGLLGENNEALTAFTPFNLQFL